MNVLVTGGAGYIGSHTCVELLDAGYRLVVIDNLSNSKREALRRVEAITGKHLTFYRADLRDQSALATIFAQEGIDSVIHFAGLKAVGESVLKPLLYYQNNIGGTLTLLEVMKSFGIKNIVFSSSATVYGDPIRVPITEDFPVKAVNPYGATKLMIETILQDLQRSDPKWNVVILRYFNPVGAHSSGQIGEDPNGIPNNLMPFIAQVAVGRRSELAVFGADYPTPDGTGVRDYIHVVDLARGHIQALQMLSQSPGAVVYNLGTGRGYSVLEMIRAFEQASGRTIPYRITARRPGDIAICYADAQKAARELNWNAELGLEQMCADTWRWQSQNPAGFPPDMD